MFTKVFLVSGKVQDPTTMSCNFGLGPGHNNDFTSKTIAEDVTNIPVGMQMRTQPNDMHKVK